MPISVAVDSVLSDKQLTLYTDKPLRFLFQYVYFHKGAFFLVFLTVTMALGCGAAASYTLRILVDTLKEVSISSGASPWPVWRILAVLVAFIAADNILWRGAGWVASGVFVKVTGEIRQDLFRYLLGHSTTYFTNNMSGSLAGRISAIASAVFSLENLLAWSVIPPCINIVYSIGLILTVSPYLGFCVVFSALLLCFILFKMGLTGRPLHMNYATYSSDVEGKMIDAVGNIGLVRLFGQKHYETARLGKALEKEMQARTLALRYMEKLRFVHAVFTAFLIAGILCWVVYLWQNGNATLGDVVMVVGLGFMILHGTRDLAVALVDATQHQARLAEGLKKLLSPHETVHKATREGQIVHSAYQKNQEASSLAVEVLFDHITFSYHGRDNLFEGFTLKIDRGTKVGLVGTSGAGKSTLFSLLLGFYSPARGKVCIDGVDITALSEEQLRQQIAVVPQEVSLFHRSIKENIRYGCFEATDAEVYQAAQAAECYEFIMSLPEGFETLVGEKGIRLSGGQKQRLAIARAFLKNAPVIIFDEATSALDTETEKKIQHVLHKLMVGKTVIAIAHRLSTLEQFDRIVVLQKGKIIQDGAPEHLENTAGVFQNLLKAQGMKR
ncbi:ABC transporter ATP-binding protein [Entomobacter blattae]|uniref:Multidrug export ATP-binding/permease protein n=1 Tax=Entomobacter blattae TaxID=2762277 RepID=A0A7H1NUX3_9PROT|nr:ABC transporter ATP-binding protein [Entomobacter blattae]QNT79583.1 Putative multidrug export ATP-binding/permease protein [Entomobacter blattae]